MPVADLLTHTPCPVPVQGRGCGGAGVCWFAHSLIRRFADSL